jgi:fatty-acyl-CoA synthase
MTNPAIEIDPANAKFARQAWLRALDRTASIERNPKVTLPVLLGQLAVARQAAPALVSSEATLSYRQLASRANQYARWGLAQGLKEGDAVALLMGNCAEYMCVWLGLTRMGATVALANTNLAGAALLHSINIVAPKLIIVDEALAPNLAAIHGCLALQTPVWVFGRSSSFAPLEQALYSFPGEPLTESECRSAPLDAAALYIYTSGTTGLPKAAKVSHYRLLQWSHWFAGLMDTGPADRMYDCLPLYHSVGGVVATGATLLGGGAVVIRARFSASDFWRDICEQRCTLFQYIGELCRYLVNAAPQPCETGHSLRIACGNGLRVDVWEKFRSRFRIPRILEYYASTEGNFSLYNCEGQPGAIGRIPPFLAQRLPVALLRFDVDSGVQRRNAAGFCEHCAVDEVGEAVGLIPDPSGGRAGRFEGYADREASERKILHNVFKAGDSWYRTGDLMRRDARGFFYFVDRVGETFRWKGENVSTAEVLSTLMGGPGVIDGVVFGVAVPGSDGRAGMAALVVDSTFDPASFRAQLMQCLPSYARPLFLRLLPALATTGTFKPRKQELMEAGFDPAKSADPLYFDDLRAGAYVPLDASLYAQIIAGEVRL